MGERYLGFLNVWRAAFVWVCADRNGGRLLFDRLRWDDHGSRKWKTIDGMLTIVLVRRPPSRSMLSVLGTVFSDGSARG